MVETDKQPAVDHLDQWTAQLRQIEQGLTTIHAERIMFRALTAAIQERGGDTPETWRNHYARMYIAAQGMAVRRLVRGKRSDVSLGGLLKDLTDNASSVTAERLRARGAVPEHFVEEWGNGASVLDSEIPRQDRDEIFREVSATLTWADLTIAHIPIGGEPVPFTFGELEHAIQRTTGIFLKYHQLLRGTRTVDFSRLHPSWVSTFDRPLFPESPV